MTEKKRTRRKRTKPDRKAHIADNIAGNLRREGLEKVLGEKAVFTTGEIAEVFSVNINTVVKWIETDLLRGYKLPGSSARRVHRNDLIEFITSQNLEITEDYRNSVAILLVCARQGISNIFSRMVENSFGYELQVAGNAFEAGLICAKSSPDIVFVDMNSTGFGPEDYERAVGKMPQLTKARLVAVVENAGERAGAAQRGFGSSVEKSAGEDGILDVIDDIISKKQLHIPRFTIPND